MSIHSSKESENWLERATSVQEINNSKILQNLFWALWLGSFICFYNWSDENFGAKNMGLCWPHFQDCNFLRFFDAFPQSYESVLFYTLIFVALSFQAFWMSQKKWHKAVFVASLVLVWQIYAFFFLSYSIPANYEYFHMSLSIVFLWSSHKEYFCKRVLILLYVLSVTLKWQESWTLATYFSPLTLGLPFFSKEALPIATNFVILLETLCPLLLTTGRKQRVVFWALMVFHLYSIVLIGYRYPIHSMLPLWILFYPKQNHLSTQSSFGLKSSVGWLSLMFWFVWQLPHMYYSDENKWDLRAYKYGVGMFEANHQCFSQIRVLYKDGHEELSEDTSRAAQKRCQVYATFYFLKKQCQEDTNIERIEWLYAHSVNDSAMKKQVDTKNVCELNYNWPESNDWVIPFEEAEVLGYPYPNHLNGEDPYKPEPMISEEPQIKPTKVQAFLKPYNHIIVMFWQILWGLSLILWVYRDYKLHAMRSRASVSSAQ